MTKKKLPVRFTGQHFTIDKVLIKDAIRQADISNQDTVLDIGAGKGFLTVHLLKIANNGVSRNLVGINFRHPNVMPNFAVWKTITYRHWHRWC